MYTKGPWEVGEDFGIARRCLVTAQARDICRCETEYGDDEANAYLIAAAPELLKALQEMVATYQDHPQYDNSDEQWEAKAVGQAQAAIAKALSDEQNKSGSGLGKRIDQEIETLDRRNPF